MILSHAMKRFPTAIPLPLIVVCGLVTSTASGATRAARAKVPGHTPVVMLILDELPTATLMNRKGGINTRRFPGFAAMARSSTWYPDHSTVADFTGRAVPAILTGTQPDVQTLPTAADQPKSIFRVFGGAYRLHVMEAATELCPPHLCPHGHRLRRPLPPGLDAGTFVEEKFHPVDPAPVVRFIRKIPHRARSLTVLHAQLPHQPYRLLPDGRTYQYSPLTDIRDKGSAFWGAGEPGIAMMEQRHYIQTAFADQVVSKMIRRLHNVGLWRKAMVVVTADHGATFQPGVPQRIATPEGLGGIANPPLFIKYPGQHRPEISLRHSRSVDILPTIEQTLGITPRFKTEGEPISEVGYSRPIALSAAGGNLIEAPVSKMLNQRDAIIKSSYQRLGGQGIKKLGPAPEMLGTRIRRARPAAGRSALLFEPDRYDSVRPRSGSVPAFVTGTLTGVEADSVILISVGRRVVATTRAFNFRDEVWFGSVLPAGALKSGVNKVGVFKAGPSGSLVRLRGN